MKLIIHDLEEKEAIKFAENAGYGNDVKLVGSNMNIRTCIGCFGCWVKTPGACIIKDSIQDIGKWIAQCDEIIIISECIYGSYSPFVRMVLDRSISYLLPYLTISRNEMHHKRRYKKHSAKLQVLFYGDSITEIEKQTARNLVEANARNIYTHGNSVSFFQNPSELEVA